MSSRYFRAMFASEMAEKSQERVTLNGVEPVMINLIVQYAYSSEINITKTNVQSLLSAANLLQVSEFGGRGRAADKPRVYYLFLKALEDAILHLIEGDLHIDDKSDEIGARE